MKIPINFYTVNQQKFQIKKNLSAQRFRGKYYRLAHSFISSALVSDDLGVRQVDGFRESRGRRRRWRGKLARICQRCFQIPKSLKIFEVCSELFLSFTDRLNSRGNIEDEPTEANYDEDSSPNIVVCVSRLRVASASCVSQLHLVIEQLDEKRYSII